MQYYEKTEDGLVPVEYETASEEVKRKIADAQKAFTIYEHYYDWADDDTDWGMGYDYDNSFEVYLEPTVSETVVENGTVIGFLPDGAKQILLIDGERTIDQREITNRYGSGSLWKLIEDEPPAPGRILCFTINENDSNRVFTPEDFPDGLVESVVKKEIICDNRGYYDNRLKIWVLLTEQAMEDREKAIRAICEAKGARSPYICKRI